MSSSSWQMGADNRTIMSLQHPKNKQFHTREVNKTSILPQTWQVNGTELASSAVEQKNKQK